MAKRQLTPEEREDARRARWRAWRTRHFVEQRIRESESDRAYRAAHPIEAAMRNMVWSAAYRSRKTGIEFGDLRHIANSAPTECACCGASFDFTLPSGSGRKGKKRNLLAPTLDRIDNTKGYTRENTAVICCGCNLRKGNATLDHLRAIVAYMERGLNR